MPHIGRVSLDPVGRSAFVRRDHWAGEMLGTVRIVGPGAEVV